MNELINEAKSELKRVEHLFFVSLKYTRTADVIRNLVERLINSLGFGFDAFLEHAKKNKVIEKIPKAPRAKSQLLKEIYPDDEHLISFIEFYILLRDIKAAPYTKREEYRRHVTMTSEIAPGKFIDVDIDLLSEYLKKLHLFIEYIKEKIELKKG